MIKQAQLKTIHIKDSKIKILLTLLGVEVEWEWVGFKIFLVIFLDSIQEERLKTLMLLKMFQFE